MQADTLLADKAFYADERVIEPLLAAGKTPVIPPKSNRKTQRTFDKDMYKARHLIENFLLQAQGISGYRHPLRQNREKLPRRNSIGRGGHFT